MTWFLLAIALGLVALVWSAGRFVAGAAALATHFGLSPLLVGMLIVGFGTSAPELSVSAIAAAGGAPALALGNGWGSNIVNIGLILGLTALIRPLRVTSRIVRREIPILLAVTALAAVLAADLVVGRGEAAILIAVFAGLIGWSIAMSRGMADDPMGDEIGETDLSLRRALLWTAIGLVVLIAASRGLVWGAVGLAGLLGVSDLIVGLTVVAVGTSLPELASSIAAARRGHHELALGNVIGSNLFNTLAVVGLAGAIAPIPLAPEVLTRDLAVMAAATVALFVFCAPFRGRVATVTRGEGAVLIAGYAGYTGWLILTALG